MQKILLLFTLIVGAYASQSFAIIGGVKANGSLSQVVNLRIYKDSRAVSLCTGTVVGEKTILTAAHCLMNAKLNVFETDSRRVELDFGEGRSGIFAYAIPSGFKKIKEGLDRVLSERNSRTALAIRNELLQTATSDIALIYTREKISLPEAPLEISSSLSMAGDSVELAGFGVIEESGSLIYPEELYRGRNTVSKKLNSVLLIEEKCGMAISSAGDSGGPLLNSSGELIGVLSGGGPLGGKRESFYVDLSSWRLWLQGRIR